MLGLSPLYPDIVWRHGSNAKKISWLAVRWDVLSGLQTSGGYNAEPRKVYYINEACF
jgi:hypothetical protein